MNLLRYIKYSKRIAISVCLLVLHCYGFAQTTFYGILINKADSTAIPYAAVTAKETGRSVVTDSNGAFRIDLPKDIKEVTLRINAIGVKTTVSYTAPFGRTEVIYVDVAANTLHDFSLKGLSAEEVVKKAVAAIPDNYEDSAYFNFSFYRRYQKLNGRYVNLMEACPVVMFRVEKKKNRLAGSEAYAVTQLRRSKYHPDIMNEREDNPADLVSENPIYHLDVSSLLPNRFPNYYFRFDTTNKAKEDYVIQYFCNNFSMDKHGIAYYTQLGIRGEEYETGRLVIDRATFAIKNISRKSIRHEDYEYPSVPGIIPPNMLYYDNRTYYFEFRGGDMEVEYKEHNGKWYLDKIFRQYSHDFYLATFDTKDYSITDNFEWHAGPISRYTTKKYADQFFPVMATAIHSYDTAFWNADSFPFHYAEQEDVYRDVQRDGPVEQQFMDEARVDGYPDKKGKN